MEKTTFTIIYWSIAIVVIILVYIAFAKFRDYIINYGKKAHNKYMEKIDPDLEDLDNLDKLDGKDFKE